MSNQGMRVFRWFLPAWTAVVLSACAAAPTIDIQLTRLGPTGASFESHTGFAAPTNIVVRNQAEWEALWNTVYAGVTPRPILPVVDFGTYLIVARAMGPRPTGGFHVMLDGLIRQSGEYLVHVREIHPGPGCGVTLAVTSPIDIARIARHDDPIRFAISTEVRRC